MDFSNPDELQYFRNMEFLVEGNNATLELASSNKYTYEYRGLKRFLPTSKLKLQLINTSDFEDYVLYKAEVNKIINENIYIKKVAISSITREINEKFFISPVNDIEYITFISNDGGASSDSLEYLSDYFYQNAKQEFSKRGFQFDDYYRIETFPQRGFDQQWLNSKSYNPDGDIYKELQKTANTYRFYLLCRQ